MIVWTANPLTRVSQFFMSFLQTIRFLSVATLVLLVAPAWAQSSLTTRHDSSLPIEIAADTLEVQQEQNLATFSGNVQAKQGEIRLRANILKVHYRPQQGDAAVQGAISRIDATGKVFFSSPGQTAQGDSSVYDVDKGLITMNGNVVLTRDKNVIRGNRLVLNLTTGKSKVEGGTSASGGRVRGLFVPNKKPPQ